MPEATQPDVASRPRAEPLIRLLRVLRRPIYYPSSFLKLIIAGFLLVSLPLIFAIVNNAVSIHEIVERSQRTVQQAVQATQTSRLIIEQANAMERSVRQFTALGDTALLEGYDHARVRFLEAAQRMGSFRLDAEQSNQLKTLKQRELDIAQAVEAGRSKPRRSHRCSPSSAPSTCWRKPWMTWAAASSNAKSHRCNRCRRACSASSSGSWSHWSRSRCSS
jgi:hypothetical protein